MTYISYSGNFSRLHCRNDMTEGLLKQ